MDQAAKEQIELLGGQNVYLIHKFARYERTIYGCGSDKEAVEIAENMELDEMEDAGDMVFEVLRLDDQYNTVKRLDLDNYSIYRPIKFEKYTITKTPPYKRKHES